MLVAICSAVWSGCATPGRSISQARHAFATGDLAAAEQTLTDVSESSDRFADAAALDLAMVQFASGDLREAQSRLRALRDRFDALPAVSPTREAASWVSDDTVRTFRPAGYEQVMIRAMLAVCSLSGDASDAESYLLQAALRGRELAQAAQQRGLLDAGELYQPIALASYLRGTLREATHRDYEDAARAYRLVSAVRPNFPPLESDLARVQEGTHSRSGHGVVYVVACVGRGPVLRETTAPATSAALSIASGVLQTATTRSAGQAAPWLPNIAAVKVPQVHLPASAVSTVSVDVGRTAQGATQTLTDVGQLAERQLAAEQPWTIARAIVRRAVKESTVAGIRSGIGLDGAAGSLFQFAAASAWSSMEDADTRCWGLLPREVQVLRVELPAGEHTLRLTPLDSSGRPVGAAKAQQVTVVDGRNHYVVAIAPDRVLYLTP